MGETLAIWIGVIVVLALILLAFIKANLHICAPNEILIFSGKKRKLPDKTRIGYRIIKGGRGFKLPIVETVRRMSLATIPIEIGIKKALSQGIIPINVECIANIKVAGTEDEGLSNAVERFLGKTPEQISQIAKEVLEGNLRGVLATLTPEEANNKRLEFAQKVMQEARDDLQRLGLVLDTLKILNISDDQGYLESIGRKKNVTVLRDARIAEAEADAEARRVSAEAKKNGSVAEAEAEMSIVEAENKLKVKKAELASLTNQAEERAKVAGEIARVEKEKSLQEKRIDVNRSKYQADVVIPAQADKEAHELKAAGEAAKIIEDGKATAEAVKLMREQWEKGNTRELFLIQQLPDIIDKVTSTVKDNLSIEKLTIVDSGNGGGIPHYLQGVTGSVVAIMEQIKNATGLDVPELLRIKAKEGKHEGQIRKELR